MTDVLKMSRKALTVGIVLSTILWSMMASVLVAPLKASAAGCTSGSLIKGSLAAVYYCGADGKRYVFTNDKNYFTWYPDFSGVMIISDADLANIMIGGNVTYRPGVKMIKIQSDPKVYAVAHGGVLRHVPSEACAVTLYGTDWNHGDTQDVSDAFFTNYSVGAAISPACNDYSPTAEMSSSQTINQDKGLGGATSGLSASLASDTPAAQTLPLGANAVNFVKFNVSNGTGASVNVDTVTVHRVGAGSPSDFGNVYLYEGNTRLTTGRSVNSSSNDVTFNSLGLMLAAGQTRSLWVAATISSTAGSGNVNAFQVTHVLSGTSDAVGLPIQGNNMTIAGASVGSIGVDMSGSLTNPKVGQLQAKIGEFRLTASSVEDMDVKRVTLFQGGSLSRNNLTNLKLKQSGSDVASAASVDEDDRITFVFLNASLLEKGNSRTYEVWGDIGAGARVDETIDLYVEEDVDVWAVGRTYGQGVQVCRSGSATSPCSASDDYDGSAGNGTDSSQTTVEGGQVTLTFNGPASHDIATNAKDQEVFNFTIASQANVEVRNLRMRLAATGDGLISAGTTANYTDFKANDQATGVTVAGPKDVNTAGSDTSQDFVFTDTFTLNAGQSRTFKVTLDVANNTALDGSTVTASLLPFQSSDIRNLDNSTYVATTDIVPSSTISGNAMTIRTPALTVSTASTPVSQTYIKGSQNVDLAGISLKAGDAADMRVTAITVVSRVEAATSTNTPSQGCDSPDTDGSIKRITDILLSAKLMNGAAQVGDLKSPSSSSSNPCTNDGGQLSFTNLNLLVPKGQTLTLNLMGNLSSSIALLPDYIDFTVAASAVTAQDPEGNSVTATGSVDSNTMTISDNGSMTYALAPDDTESEAGLVIGGTTAVLAKYRFTAQNEELKLTKVRMALPNGSATAVQSLWLYDGATLVAGPVAPNSLGAADFSGFSFVVPKDGSKTLTVKGMLNAVGSGGAASGLDLTVQMCDGAGSDCYASGSETGTYEVRGTSAGSSTVDTTGNSDDVTAREKRIRKTKPTVSPVSIPTQLSNGTQLLSRFTVTADSAQQVSFKTVTFELGLNGTMTVTASASTTETSVRESGGVSNLAGTMTLTGTCAAAGTCTAKAVFATEQTIAAGTSKTYELRMDVSGADGTDSISTKLLGDSANVTGELCNTGKGVSNTFPGPAACADYNFIWSDNSAIPHNDSIEAVSTLGDDDATASNDWTNARFVKILPSDTQTVSF